MVPSDELLAALGEVDVRLTGVDALDLLELVDGSNWFAARLCWAMLETDT